MTPDELAKAPPWFQRAYREIGTRELPENRGPDIRRYIRLADAGQEGDPWCAIFVNAMLEACGVNGTRSASSQSFRHNDCFVKLDGPALGAVAVFWRGTPSGGLGHVGFYRGENRTSVWTLGGNEGDMVQIEALIKLGPHFGLVGYYWPRAFPLPHCAPVIMTASAAAHQVSVT